VRAVFSGRRKRTEQEIEEALASYSNKASTKIMNEQDKEKASKDKKEWLERTMTRQTPSRAWLELNREVRKLQYRTANQRKDVLHKISRALTESNQKTIIKPYDKWRVYE